MSMDAAFGFTMSCCAIALVILCWNNPWRKPKHKGTFYVIVWRYTTDTTDRYDIYGTRKEAFEHLGRLAEASFNSKTFDMTAGTVKEITL